MLNVNSQMNSVASVSPNASDADQAACSVLSPLQALLAGGGGEDAIAIGCKLMLTE